jgi:hypothetical protein
VLSIPFLLLAPNRYGQVQQNASKQNMTICRITKKCFVDLFLNSGDQKPFIKRGIINKQNK